MEIRVSQVTMQRQNNTMDYQQEGPFLALCHCRNHEDDWKTLESCMPTVITLDSCYLLLANAGAFSRAKPLYAPWRIESPPWQKPSRPLARRAANVMGISGRKVGCPAKPAGQIPPSRSHQASNRLPKDGEISRFKECCGFLGFT